jgi:hypothetical protein
MPHKRLPQASRNTFARQRTPPSTPWVLANLERDRLANREALLGMKDTMVRGPLWAKRRGELSELASFYKAASSGSVSPSLGETASATTSSLTPDSACGGCRSSREPIIRIAAMACMECAAIASRPSTHPARSTSWLVTSFRWTSGTLFRLKRSRTDGCCFFPTAERVVATTNSIAKRGT